MGSYINLVMRTDRNSKVYDVVRSYSNVDDAYKMVDHLNSICDSSMYFWVQETVPHNLPTVGHEVII